MLVPPRSHMSCEIHKARLLQPSSSCAENKHIVSSTWRGQFDPLAPHSPSGQTRLLLPSARTHTPCSDACPERELHETCLVLTDDTRLVRRELFEEVEGEIVEGRLVTKVETRLARATGNRRRCVL